MSPHTLAAIEAAIARTNALPQGPARYRAVLALCDTLRTLSADERLARGTDEAQPQRISLQLGAKGGSP